MGNEFLEALETATARAKTKPTREKKQKSAIQKKKPREVEEAESTSKVSKAGPKTEKAPCKASRAACYLFEKDIRALASIREKLESAGHDFVNKSDAVKVGLRVAANMKPEQLSKVLSEVKKEDMRFKKPKS